MNKLVLAVLLLLYSVAEVVARPKIALVLTGGGARGISQIGVLKELQRRNIEPDIVVGTSIGAIIGGLYSSGYDAFELDTLFSNIKWEEFTSLKSETKRETLFLAQKAEEDRSLVTLRFRDFEFIAPRAVGGSARFSAILQEFLWNSPYNTITNFDSLRCVFRAVATNLHTGKPMALANGNLATAVRASATFPLRYNPVQIDTSVYVDGGLVANIPTDIARELGAELIIVVNTTSPLRHPDVLYSPWSVADQALSAAMKQRDSIMLAKADIVIQPRMDGISTFDFENISELISAGESAASEALKFVEAIPGMQRERPNYSENMIVRGGVYIVGGLGLELQEGYVQDVVQDMLGRTWSNDFYRYWKPQVAKAFHKSGLPFATVTSMAFDTAQGRVHIVINPGKITSVSAMYGSGLSDIDLQRELAFTVPSYAPLQSIAQTVDNIRASERWSDIDVLVRSTSDSTMQLQLRGTDVGNQMLRIGARIDNERNTQAGFDVIHQNLFNTSMRVAVRGVVSERVGELTTVLEVPRISGTLWTATLRGYTSFRNVWIYGDSPESTIPSPRRERVEQFSEDRIGARLSAGRQLERNGVILGEFRYEQQRYRSLEANVKPQYQALATVRGVVRWDDRDRVFFARRGRVIDLFSETSILNRSNSLSFTKLSARITTTHSIGSFAITPNFMIGAADRTLPGAELFSLGGQDMFFGMREDEERGRQIVVGNLEGRLQLPFDIFFDTYVMARYDIGAVYAQPENIRIGTMQHALGLSLALDTPVGPAIVSMGKRFYFLDKPATVAVGPLLVYFSIGARF